MNDSLKVFSGSSHPELAQDICDELGVEMGKSRTVRFANDNLFVQIEENVREKDAFVLQTSLPAEAEGGNIEQVSVAKLFAGAIKAIHTGESVSALFR